MNIPPAGTMCADCGGCQAGLYAGDTPLCWACDAGEPCDCTAKDTPTPGTIAAAAMDPAAMQIATAPINSAIASNIVPLRRKFFKTAFSKEKKVTITSTRGKGAGKIDEKIRKAIIQAPASISHSELAREHGISDVSVYTIRKAAGIKLIKHPQNKAEERKFQREAKPVTFDPIPVETFPERAEANITLGSGLSVQVNLDEALADAIWKRCSLKEKAYALQAALTAGLDSL